MESTAFSHLYRNEENGVVFVIITTRETLGTENKQHLPEFWHRRLLLLGWGEWCEGLVLSDAWTSDFVGGWRGDISLWALSNQSG